MEQHFIVCGLGRVGERVLEHLRSAGAPVAVIDNRAAPGDARLGGVTLIAGDCRGHELWEQAGLARSQGVLILTSNDLLNIATALMVRRMNPGVRIVVRMFNESLVSRLGKAVKNIVALSASALAAPILALIARTGKALGTFRLEDGRLQQITELVVPPQSSFEGRTIDEALSPQNFQAVALVQGAGETFFGFEIARGTRLAAGDRLFVCGEADRIPQLLGQFSSESLPELLWAGFMRRMGRIAWSTFKEVDLPVKICTGVLFAVIITSVLVFHLGMARDTPVDAFYRTISLMATGADMGGGALPDGAWQKAFISSLRMLGMALVAAFTAILTNYLVRAHLGGALEVRRIPERGHVIVCGLGNVGFRVMQELLRHDERVVAIERTRDSAFVPTARRQGVAVIIGNATIMEVLKQAHAESARAVVAATDNELANIEIALLVRELDPKMRVVLRLSDVQLARTLRAATNIRLALSIPELAGPAFVAALFGDRVRNIFSVDERLFAVVDLVAYPEDPLFAGKTLAQLQGEFRLLPLALRRGDGTVPLADHATVQPGDRLTVILSLPDLQRLLRQERVPKA